MHPYSRANVFVAYGYGLSGAGVIIGVADTGYHLDADGRPVHQEFSATNKLTVSPTSPRLTSDAHGMHVSALAAGDRNGLGMMGIAYNARLLIGMSPEAALGLKGVFDAYNDGGALVSNNSYGMTVNGTEGTSPWRPILTSVSGGLEVTARNAIAYRDANGLTTAQMMEQVMSGTAAQWTAAVASMAAFQARGGVIVWSNSNYGQNDIDNGDKGLDDADLGAALPLAFTQLRGGWITVVNGTSLGLAIQANGQAVVNKATKKEGNFYLNSAQCGSAAAFCLTMDGTAMWSASNNGVASYESQTGTSQAGPEVAGMLALLREAFPAASAADLAARLLFTADNSFFLTGTVSNRTTATYSNANGTLTKTVSDIWGHGIPDLRMALAPVGNPRTKLGNGATVDLSQLSGQMQLARAFGDAGSGLAGANFLYNDMLDGIFVGSLHGTVRAMADTSLYDTVSSQLLARDMTTVTNGNGLSFALGTSWGVAGSTFLRPNIAFSATQRLSEASAISLGFGFSADNALGFAPRHAGLRTASLSDTAMGIPYLGFGSRGQSWASGSTGISKFDIRLAAFNSTGVQPFRNAPVAGGSLLLASMGQPGFGGGSHGVVADVIYDGLGFAKLNLSLGTVRETGSVLGSVANSVALRQGADSRFIRVGVQVPIINGWSLQGNYTTATTQLRGAQLGLLSDVSGLRTDAMALAISGDNVFLPNARLTFGIAQPLRVTGGQATLNLPQTLTINAPGDYSYGFKSGGVNFTPGGRQVDYSIEYSQQVGPGFSWGISGRLMEQPGHIAAAPMAAQGLLTLKLAM